MKGEIADLTEISNNDEESNNNRDNAKGAVQDDIEIGLEIVSLEMGRILEELKDNLRRLPWTTTKVEVINKANSAIKKVFPASVRNNNTNQQKIVPNSSASISNRGSKQLRYKTKHPPSSNNNNTQQQKIKPKESSKIAHEEKSDNSNTNDKSKFRPAGEKAFDYVINNSKPNYQVQKTNYPTNFEKIQRLRSNIVPKSSNYSFVNSKTSVQHRISNAERTSLCDKRLLPNTTSIASNSSSVRKSYVSRQSSLACTNKNQDALKQIRDRVELAIREKKTFTVCGNYYTIRRALLSRGWIEKIRIMYNTYDRDHLKKIQACSVQDLLNNLTDPQNGYVYKRMLMSKLLGQHQVDFYWDQNFDCFRVCRDNVKLTMINRFKRGIFSYTSKQGLCESMKKAYWFNNPGTSCVRHPRSYNLSNSLDPKDFINDFKLTAAMSLLKWIVKTQDNFTNDRLTSFSGKLSLNTYRFAVNELSKIIRKCKHEDIDYEIEDAMDYEWNEFLENYYKAVHIGNIFKREKGKESFRNILIGAKNMLKKIEKYWPHLNMDGMMNIWILKPTNGSRGEGIFLCRTLQYILKIIKANTTRRYIVQKYIERPLLIYNTKFDIRQWFLISSAVPLTIWIYKDCYVRFSSQIYNLRKLHESVHLTNNSIQSKYKNCSRSPALPVCNMWDTHQFIKYLESIGHPKVFKEVIYPGMKECITGAIIINQSNLDIRKNCFELYGSDFMLTEDFKPWLIEINSKPALYPSTPVTARMCPQVLDDVIKVIIDFQKNPKAPTGHFELLYKQKIPKLPDVELDELRLVGRPLQGNYFFNPEMKPPKLMKSSYSSDDTKYNRHAQTISKIGSDMKKTLEDLLQLIQAERERRKRLKHRFTNTNGEFKEQKSKKKTCESKNKNNEDNKSMDINTDNNPISKDDLEITIIKDVNDALGADNESITESRSSTELDSDSMAVIPITSKNTKTLFNNIIETIKNLSFNYRISNQT